MSRELFKVGDKVVWDDEFSYLVELDSQHPLPLTIVQERTFTDECSCGGSFGDQDHVQLGRCPYKGLDPEYDGLPLLQTRAHPQLVKLQDADGVDLDSTYSGSYFKHV